MPGGFLFADRHNTYVIRFMQHSTLVTLNKIAVESNSGAQRRKRIFNYDQRLEKISFTLTRAIYQNLALEFVNGGNGIALWYFGGKWLPGGGRAVGPRGPDSTVSTQEAYVIYGEYDCLR